MSVKKSKITALALATTALIVTLINDKKSKEKTKDINKDIHVDK